MGSILAVVGPTGTGKTELACAVAEQTGGEIISADSRQIYRHLEIGTAKPTPAQRRRVRFHLVDIVDPDEHYSCGAFARDATAAIDDIQGRGRRPIVCGGTGLYIRALFQPLHVLPRSDPETKRRLRQELAERGLAALYRELAASDAEWARKVKPTDTQRILRGLEVARMTGKPLSWWLRQERPAPRHQPRYVGLTMERARLYARLNDRFDRMLAEGLEREVQELLKTGRDPECPGLRTIGYAEIVDHLLGRMSREEAIARAKQRTRNYAKRQLTWFARLAGLTWLDVGSSVASLAQLVADEPFD